MTVFACIGGEGPGEGFFFWAHLESYGQLQLEANIIEQGIKLLTYPGTSTSLLPAMLKKDVANKLCWPIVCFLDKLLFTIMSPFHF